jgi:hypothetical protein
MDGHGRDSGYLTGEWETGLFPSNPASHKKWFRFRKTFGTRQSMRNPFIDIDLALSAAARRRMASGADEDPAGDPTG